MGYMIVLNLLFHHITKPIKFGYQFLITLHILGYHFIKQVLHSVTDINDDGTVEDWNDRFLIPPMLKLIQEQKQMIDDLECRLSQLERKE